MAPKKNTTTTGKENKKENKVEEKKVEEKPVEVEKKKKNRIKKPKVEEKKVEEKKVEEKKEEVKTDVAPEVKESEKKKKKRLKEKYTYQVNQEKLAELKEIQSSVRIGGKGSMRRKKKVVPKSQEESKIHNALKKIGSKEIDDVEEANFFMEDDSILHFQKPRCVGQVNANTMALFGTPQQKDLKDLFPGIITQLGPEDLGKLQNLSKGLKADTEDIPSVNTFEQTN
jgi:nascent polypeptide-associated complex subunit beta